MRAIKTKWLRMSLVLLLAVSLVSVPWGAAADGGAETVVLRASKDSWVNGGSNSGVKYGERDRFKVKRTSTENRDAFVAFDASSVEGAVQSAILKLFVVSMESETISSGGAYDIEVRGMTDDSWVETDITYETASADEGTPIGTMTVNQSDVGSYISLDVTSFVQLHQDDMIGFRIRGVDVSKGADYASKEHGSGNAPLLEVTYDPEGDPGNPDPEPEPQFDVNFEQTAIDDTYVQSGEGPFGTGQTMNVKSNSSGSDIRRAYLKFDLPEAAGLVAQALVKVYVNGLENSTPAEGYDVTLYGIHDDSWDEVTLTHANQPTAAGIELDRIRVNSDSVGTYIQFDATSFVQAQTDGQVSFYIQSTNNVSRGAHYRTKEHSGNTPPLLAIGVNAYTVPAVPEAVQASVGSKRVELTWEPSANATEYAVLRSLSEDGPYETVGHTAETRYIDVNVVNDVMYYYRIRAQNPGFESEMSETIAATPIYPLLVAVPVFTDLAGQPVTELSDDSFVQARLSITNITNESYRLSVKIGLHNKEQLQDESGAEGFATVHKNIGPNETITVEAGFMLEGNASDLAVLVRVADSDSNGEELYHPGIYFVD